MNHSILNLAKRIRSIAEIGLLYSKDNYDQERYTELREISEELSGLLSGQPVEVIKEFYATGKDYPTPKVDIRAMVLNAAGEILLVKEMADGKWSLPGGWADIGLSPAEIAEKECREETGLIVKATRLLAVFDKKCHPHPAQPYYVYKFALLCEIQGEPVLNKGFDMLEAAFFSVDALPPLSIDRILPSQIDLLYKKVKENDLTTYFD